MSIKITSVNAEPKTIARPATKVKVDDRFLLPRYKARVVVCTPHVHNEDLMQVKFQVLEGPNKGKNYDTLIPVNSTLDCTTPTMMQWVYMFGRNTGKVIAFSVLLVILSAFMTLPGGVFSKGIF
jgi:hypothetical protein